MVAGEYSPGLGAMLLEHLRASLDVAEQERDDTGRQADADLGHVLDERVGSHVVGLEPGRRTP